MAAATRAAASSEPRHNGDFLPLKGVVLVTINYRLGVFGFLATDDLAKEANGSAGNYGLMDMVAALQWVKANIKKFGGDPNNVTIFGESAGSFAVSTLMASPMAQGLFPKAIGESGAAFPSGVNLGGRDGDGACEDGRQVGGSRLGVKSLTELRAMPTDKILEAAKKKGTTGFSPVVDGKLLTEPVPETYAAGKQAHVPLLAGWNADEGSFFAMRGMTAAQWKAMAKQHVRGSRGGVSEAVSGRHGCAGAALGDRLRQRPVHRIRHVEVAGGAAQDRRVAGVPVSLRTGGAAEQVPSRDVCLPLRRHRVCVRHAGYAARIHGARPRIAS